MVEKKLFVLWDKEYEQVDSTGDDLEELLEGLGYDPDLKNYEIREYTLVATHKLKIVTEIKTIEQKIKKVALK